MLTCLQSLAWGRVKKFASYKKKGCFSTPIIFYYNGNISASGIGVGFSLGEHSYIAPQNRKQLYIGLVVRTAEMYMDFTSVYVTLGLLIHTYYVLHDTDSEGPGLNDLIESVYTFFFL